MPGPRPTPTAIKKARGNPGKRPLNEREPETFAERPVPPKVLTGEALIEYDRLCSDLERMGVLSSTDVGAITVAAQTWAAWLEAEDCLKREGSVIEGKAGPAQNPWVIIARNLQRDLKSYWAEFGLTPAARTKVQVTKKKKPTSPVEKWTALKGGSK